jgi:hypothetical protein
MLTDLERPLPEEHEALLKTILKLEPDSSLPDTLVELYWDAARTARRIGCNVGHELLITICLLANRATPAAPVSFLDVAKQTKVGSRVLARFRGDWRWGVYHGTVGVNVRVEIDDDTAEVREFAPTSVRLPSREELKKIGE